MPLGLGSPGLLRQFLFIPLPLSFHGSNKETRCFFDERTQEPKLPPPKPLSSLRVAGWQSAERTDRMFRGGPTIERATTGRAKCKNTTKRDACPDVVHNACIRQGSLRVGVESDNAFGGVGATVG